MRDVRNSLVERRGLQLAFVDWLSVANVSAFAWQVGCFYEEFWRE